MTTIIKTPNMNTTIQKYPLSQAQQWGIHIWKILKPHCEPGFCKIAGSIRRQKAEIKDIEIVCVPLTHTVPDGLFCNRQVRTKGFVNAMKTIGQRIKGSADDGKYCQYQMFALSIKVDVFIVEKSNFGMQFLIRTGPAEFSRKILWQFNNLSYHSKDGYPTKGEERLEFEDEQEVFEFLKIPFVEPKNR
jgi:DNA polymerase/3'-5' exonuclease PolX